MPSCANKQEIRIYFTDFWADFDIQNNVYSSILNNYYIIVVDKENPEFLFHSCFGNDHFQYFCVKIFCIGENMTPDFNITDYAYGFDNIEFDDRYLRYPLFKFFLRDDDFMTKSDNFFLKEIQYKKKFCNFIYSNAGSASPERENFFHTLSQYRKVDSGGALLNNIGHRVDDKLAWQREYKFSIAFENASKNGYTTEKILHALQAHTIPIYWGNPRVAEDFNPERFVNCHAYSSMAEVVRAVQTLDENLEQYANMLQKPWFTKPVLALPQNDPVFINFFRHIIDQGPENARRLTRYGYSRRYYLYQQARLTTLAPKNTS